MCVRALKNATLPNPNWRDRQPKQNLDPANVEQNEASLAVGCDILDAMCKQCRNDRSKTCGLCLLGHNRLDDIEKQVYVIDGTEPFQFVRATTGK